jgi:hypothetical protein
MPTERAAEKATLPRIDAVCADRLSAVVPRVSAANAVTELPGRGSTLDALIDYPRWCRAYPRQMLLPKCLAADRRCMR